MKVNRGGGLSTAWCHLSCFCQVKRESIGVMSKVSIIHISRTGVASLWPASAGKVSVLSSLFKYENVSDAVLSFVNEPPANHGIHNAIGRTRFPRPRLLDN